MRLSKMAPPKLTSLHLLHEIPFDILRRYILERHDRGEEIHLLVDTSRITEWRIRTIKSGGRCSFFVCGSFTRSCFSGESTLITLLNMAHYDQQYGFRVVGILSKKEVDAYLSPYRT